MIQEKWAAPSSPIDWKANKGVEIYGENFEKLQELKRRYDPYGGLKGPF